MGVWLSAYRLAAAISCACFGKCRARRAGRCEVPLDSGGSPGKGPLYYWFTGFKAPERVRSKWELDVRCGELPEQPPRRGSASRRAKKGAAPALKPPCTAATPRLRDESKDT